MKQTVSSMCLLTFVTYMAFTVLVSSKRIYIKPSTNDTCPERTTCVTLSQFAVNQSQININGTLILTFQPGNHSLNTELNFENIFKLVINSSCDSESVSVTCGQAGRLYFTQIETAYISKMDFSYCTLSLFSTNVKIENSSITLNENGHGWQVRYETQDRVLYENVYVGAFAIIRSNATISNTLFERNQAQVGGAVYAENSFVEIDESAFKNNQVKCYFERYICFGGAIYAYNATLMVNSTTFENNSAIGVQLNGHGGVFGMLHSSVTLCSNTFTYNTAIQGNGGVIFSQRSNITSDGNTFSRNSAEWHGGVLRSSNGHMIDRNSCYEHNQAKYYGGVMDLDNTMVTIRRSNLLSNRAGSRGGAVSMVHGSLTITESDLSENIVERSYGGAISAEWARIDIRSSNFTGNKARDRGGAIDGEKGCHLHVENCIFTLNTAGFGGAIHASYAYPADLVESNFMLNKAKTGGALSFEDSKATVTSCNFSSNSADAGGAISATLSSKVNFTRSIFCNNNANKGGVLHASGHANVQMNSVTTTFNTAKLGIMYFIGSIGTISGDTQFLNNSGSIFIYNGNFTITGRAIFANFSSSARNEAFPEGGVVTAFQSEVFIGGVCELVHNYAETGGALYATESKVHVTGNTIITNNTARKSGGGAYLHQTELNCEGDGRLTFFGNVAVEKGGAIHATSSSLRVYISINSNFIIRISSIHFKNNQAKYGGGIFLEVSARFYILINIMTTVKDKSLRVSLITFSNNIADYGGAIYVADETNSGICTSKSYEIYSSSTECFLQSLSLFGRRSEGTLDVNFVNNTAHVSGNALYGGLLDRCTVSPFSQEYVLSDGIDVNLTTNNVSAISGVKYFELYSNINLDSISSGPVSVCFCRDGYPDCNYQPQLNVTKGQRFYVELAAVNQIGELIKQAYIISSLTSGFGGFGENQTNQSTLTGCTNLTFEIFSPYSDEQLKLYAVGPCKDEALSQKVLPIKFSPCICPKGFQQKLTKTTNCVCECDSQLQKYTISCDFQTKTVIRKGNPWISYFRSSNNSIHSYLIYPHCPLGYCYHPGSNIHLNLSKPNGSDRQCIHNRTGLLCGVCKQGFSLSLGTSRCIFCPKYWPALLVLQLVAAFVAGIALVAAILILNLTVAVGTMNGIIFYANILYTFKSTFIPHSSPSFETVLISWLNLEIGFDSCFYEGMNAYSKTWMQLAFPSYVILLVLIIIVASERSKKLSNLLGKKNPVATLATLILLSYTKFLNSIGRVLSFAVISYPELNGPINKIVWLPDATVGYFTGRHILLMIAAIFILVACIIYTFLLLTWQWLAHFDHHGVIKLIRRQKMLHFMETYHAPYKPRNRYWTGLLLIVRIVMYITSAANVSGNPNVYLFVTGLAMLCLLCLKEITGINSRIYKKWPIDILEMSLYINISVLCFSTIFVHNITDDETYKLGISSTSIAIAFLQLVGIIFFHIYSEIIVKTNAWKRFFSGPTRFHNVSDLSVEITSTVPTSSVVERPQRPASQLLRQNTTMSSKTDYELRESLLDH